MEEFFWIASSALTVLLAVAFNHLTGYEIQSFSLWFILPIGGLLVGMGAASGLYFGHLRRNKKIVSKDYLAGIVLGIIAFYGIYYISYKTTYVDSEKNINYSFHGDPLSTYEIYGEPFTFSKFLELTQSSSNNQSFFRGAATGSEYETGETASKAFFYLQLAAAAFGGFAVADALKKQFEEARVNLKRENDMTPQKIVKRE